MSIQPIPSRPKGMTTAQLEEYLRQRTDLSSSEKRLRLVLEKARWAVSQSRMGYFLTHQADDGRRGQFTDDHLPFIELVKECFSMLWDANEDLHTFRG